MEKSLFRGKRERESNRGLFVSVCATAHGRSWEPCGFQTEKSLSSPFGEFLVPAACRGLLTGELRETTRRRRRRRRRGGKGELFRVFPHFSLSLSLSLSFQAMNSREKEEERKERGHTKEE